MIAFCVTLLRGRLVIYYDLCGFLGQFPAEMQEMRVRSHNLRIFFPGLGVVIPTCGF